MNTNAGPSKRARARARTRRSHHLSVPTEPAADGRRHSNSASPLPSDGSASSLPPKRRRLRMDEVQYPPPGPSHFDEYRGGFHGSQQWRDLPPYEPMTRNPPTAPRSKKPRHRHKKRGFVPGRPQPTYLDLVSEPSTQSLPVQPKLLILDLNGTLLYRKKLPAGGKKPFPRPYLQPFLSYIFHPDTPLETMIWSSAQPGNVHGMVGACFGEDWSSRLKAVWARDTLGLKREEYYQKVQTVKNLDTIWSSPLFHSYTAHSTLLVDDSPLKAHMQPFNHVVLREYDEDLFEKHRRRPSENLTEQKQQDGEEDQTLLAVIGVLSELAKESNVAWWIREGGLMRPPGYEGPVPSIITSPPPPPPDTKGKGRASSLSPPRSERSLTSSPVLPALSLNDGIDAAKLAAVETAWFQTPAIVDAWVKIGRAELVRLGIASDVGGGEKESSTSGDDIEERA